MGDNISVTVIKLSQNKANKNMTRKPFEAVAAAIRTQMDNAAGLSNEACREAAAIAAVAIARDFARIAANDNPRFDAQRFLRACGINN